VLARTCEEKDEELRLVSTVDVQGALQLQRLGYAKVVVQLTDKGRRHKR
jgi:hypothetical protein